MSLQEAQQTREEPIDKTVWARNPSKLMLKSKDSQDLWGSRNQKCLKTDNLCIVLPVEHRSFPGNIESARWKQLLWMLVLSSLNRQLLPYNNDKLVMDTFISLQVPWQILEYFLKKTELESWGGWAGRLLVCLILVFIKKKSVQKVQSVPSCPRREWHRF